MDSSLTKKVVADVEASSTRARAATAADAALCAGATCMGFLVAYGLLHALHVAGLDSLLLTKLSPIALFATFLGSCPIAIVSGALALNGTDRDGLLRVLPRLLTVTTLLFTVEICVWP